MTVHVHLERVVVDGPLPTSSRRWRAALAKAVAAELRTGPGDTSGRQPAALGGVRLASLPPAHLPRGSAGGASGVGAAVGGAVRAVIGGAR